MMNWIWAGLLVAALLFAFGSDFSDITSDRYRNGEVVPAEVVFEGELTEALVPAEVVFDPGAYVAHFGIEGEEAVAEVEALLAEPIAAGIRKTSEDELELQFVEGVVLPEPLATKAGADVNTLRSGRIVAQVDEAGGGIYLESVRLLKLKGLMARAFDDAELAVELALGLIGVLALFLGLLKIAEKAGLIDALVWVVRPVLGPLFPEIPKGHPAMGMIAMNLSANVLGLGNAATPLGLKAMKELQTLNSTKDTATNSMVMLLAMNTASVQLIPPVTVLAIMGVVAIDLYLAILLVTGLSLVIAIILARLTQGWWVFGQNDPAKQPMPADGSGEGGGA
ncbi:nucleoside recognition domain-containing protein [Mucisphaera sp.]|uniref:nucleoside recognition domain-containing protein n=1 Tax=Mucisphaera sp. TaxID=2913024 RepID=UPI003D109AE0